MSRYFVIVMHARDVRFVDCLYHLDTGVKTRVCRKESALRSRA